MGARAGARRRGRAEGRAEGRDERQVGGGARHTGSTATGRAAGRGRRLREGAGAAVLAGLRGLTLRGRCLVAGGASAAVCGLALGQRDVLRVAVLLLTLPVVSLALAARGSAGLQVTRTTTPRRTTAGGSCRVRLDLRNTSRTTTAVLLAQDAVAGSTDGVPPFVVDRLGAGALTAVAYTARTPLRGRHRLGPLRVRVSDPLGLCEVPSEATGTDEVVVLPVVEALPPVGALTPVAGWSGSGEGGADRALGASGETGMSTREYRAGDDLRRVHWRSSARHGELMVRPDEQPRQVAASVVLDTRASAHRGGRGPSSSFERAVSVAASMVTALAGAGYTVRCATGGRPGGWQRGAAGAGVLVEDLVDVVPGGDGALAAATAQALSSTVGAPASGVVVAVLGRVGPREAETLASVPQRERRACAVLLEPALGGADALLRRAGWVVLLLGRDQTLAQVWGELGVEAA